MVRGSEPRWFTILTLWVVFLAAGTSGAAIASHQHDHPHLGNNTENYTENIEKWMNPNVNPCDNFYQFVCGGIIRPPSETHEKSALSATQNEINKLLIENLEKDNNDETDKIRIIKSAKSLYRTCMKTNRKLPSLYGFIQSYILDHLNKIGGWPVILADSWNENAFDWKQVILIINSDRSWLTTLFPFKPSMTADKTPYFSEPNLALDIDDLLHGGLKNPHVAEHLENASPSTDDLTQVVKFEISLAQMFHRHLSNNSKTTNVTLRQVKNDFPFFPWDDFIKRIVYPSSHVRIRPNQRLTFVNYNFIKDYYEFVGKTDKRVLANYLAWRELESIMKPMKTLKLVEIVNFHKSESPKDEKCLSIVNHLLPFALQSLYVRKSLDRNTWRKKMQVAETIAKNVQQRLMIMLRDASWLTESSRNRAVKIVESTSFKFGYSDELYNGTMLGDYYRILEINENSMLDSVVRVDRVFRNEFAVGEGDEREALADLDEEESTELLNFEAGYNREKNRVEIPLGLFGDRFLRLGGSDPQSLNYGRFAFVIGRELGMSLVSRNQRVENTTDDNIFAASQKDFAEYENRVTCLRENYQRMHDAFSMNLMNVVNDIGYRAASLAYKSVPIKTKNHQVLNGKLYNSDQMFWINAASYYCKKENSYEPLESTVMGAFSNIQQFSDDFHCPGSSTMNPFYKCSVF